MRGRNTFTTVELERIKTLLEKKSDDRPMVQRRVRENLHRIGFYISDYDFTFAAFTPGDLEQLIKSGRVLVDENAVAAPRQSAKEKTQGDSRPRGETPAKKTASPKKDGPSRFPTLVTAAVIREGDRVLLAQRKKGVHQSDKWEFPGGRVEAGESPEKGLKRELREELGVEASIGEIFKVVYHPYTRGPILLLAYLAEIDRPAQTVDCQAVEWVDLDRLDDIEFPPADLLIVEKLKKSRTKTISPVSSSPRGLKRLLGIFGDRA